MRVVFLIMLALVGLGCRKEPSRIFTGGWQADLGYIVCKDLTRQYWLTGKVPSGEWNNPLASSAMEEMGAPKIDSITVKPKGEPSRPFDVMSTDVEITFKTEKEVIKYDLDFDLPVRGKDWYPVYDTDWKTGETKFYEARDNYINAIAERGHFVYTMNGFEPVKVTQIDNVPAQAYIGLTYRLYTDSVVIRDQKEKKQYRFVYGGKKSNRTVQVSPIK